MLRGRNCSCGVRFWSQWTVALCQREESWEGWPTIVSARFGTLEACRTWIDGRLQSMTFSAEWMTAESCCSGPDRDRAFSQPHVPSSVGREVGDPPAGLVRSAGIACSVVGTAVLKAQLKSTNRILAQVSVESRCSKMWWRAMLTASPADLLAL